MKEPTIQGISNAISQWGEGPIWWGEGLFYVDIEGHKLRHLNPLSGEEKEWDVGERIGTVVPTAHADEVIYAGETGYVRFHLKTGAKTPLADPEAALRGKNRFNDGKCDPAGRFWAGTISMIKDRGTANLYCLDAAGSCTLKASDVTNSNGLCWSADAATMYYIDTPTQKVRAYDFDIEGASIANPRVAVDTAALGYDSSPDGMTIDNEGMLWVAFCHGGCVVRFDPSSGKEIQKVELPCVETTACAFGGPQLDRLFVTTGIKSDLDEPDAGKVFVIDGLGVRGVPALAYKGSA